jgi:hypothetical protein
VVLVDLAMTTVASVYRDSVGIAGFYALLDAGLVFYGGFNCFERR